MSTGDYLLALFLFSPAGVYSLFLLWLGWRWRKIPVTVSDDGCIPSTRVSVIIAARNESNSICHVLSDVLSQDYPRGLLEVILIDDHSEDETIELARAIDDGRLKVFALPAGAHGKKASLEYAIKNATGKLLLFTDADCRIGVSWAKKMALVYEQSQYRLLVGPVVYSAGHSRIERFQSLDAAGMMGLTGAGIESGLFYLGNGANLAYERQLFEELGGFASHAATPSGDDVLLIMEAALSDGSQIGFVKHSDAIVRTNPMKTWSGMLNQRLRWASKSAYYQWSGLFFVQALAFLACAAVAINIALVPFVGKPAAIGALFSLLIKSMSDYKWLRLTTGTFGQGDNLRGFSISEALHLSTILSVGLMTIMRSPWSWKGRSGFVGRL